MASPYSTGGGGTHFEARIAAHYLAAALSEAPARGCLAQYVLEVSSQRAAFDEPLDDVIVSGRLANGRRAKLYLQAKSDLAFTENNEEWVSVLHQAWDTFTGNFDQDADRMGVAINTYNAKVDRHYQSVLQWATYSTSGQHFVERIEKPDYSHSDKTAFVKAVRSILDAHNGTAIGDDQLWRFLRSFVILHFDFAQGETSRDAEGAQDRLRAMLPTDQRADAGRLWDHLIAKAGELIPAGGAATRATLVPQLQADGLPTGTATSLWRDLEAVNRASFQALGDIKSSLHGLRLHRQEAVNAVYTALADGRFVQVEGEPGAGKSALLKELAEEAARFGPVFVLKDARIQPKGWSAHAHTLAITADATALLRELGTAGRPILFIDGIDKVVDPDVHHTVNDLIRAIASDPTLSQWRILATVREQNLEHISTWLDPDALAALPVRQVSIGALGNGELKLIADAFPRLRSLLHDGSGADVILRRLFFLDAMLTLAGRQGTSALPATEVELMGLWWSLGGTDAGPLSAIQHRRNALVDLAASLAKSPGSAITINDMSPEPLEELKSAGVIRDKTLGHTVVFTHDIYEEWALCELLIGKQTDTARFLTEVGEPQALVRPAQLLGSYMLETFPSVDEWKALLENVSDPSLRPVWQRAILTSCLHSTRTTELLGKLSDYLTDNDNERLKRLLVALQTLEVMPNPLFLNETLVPNLTAEERVTYANLTAIPKLLIWVRFLDWFMQHPGTPWPSLLGELLPTFKVWLDNCAGQNIRHCQAIGEAAHTWLVEFESARHPPRLQDMRQPFGIHLDYHGEESLEKSIRSLFLSSAGDAAELVKTYLVSLASRKPRHLYRDEVVASSMALARFLPKELVDFILTTFLKHPANDRDHWTGGRDSVMRELGVEGHDSFYPASPSQAPFLQLLRFNETEGLRLVRGLCNHSIDVWKWTQRRGRWGEKGVTPLPIKVTFPWGEQTFWGDGQVYLWFRGMWGNAATGSGMMALEQWAFEQIEKDRPFAEVLRTVVEGNDSLAALGLAASLCIAYPQKSVEHALPVITCPYIWKWDIQRLIQDQKGLRSNEIGDWHHHKHMLQAVRTLNDRPHRKHDIRSLVPYFVFSPDKATRTLYAKLIRKFPKQLPFDFEEERKHAGAVAELRERMQLFSEQADPKYWRQERTPDGLYVQLINEPPSLKKQKHVEQQQRQEALNLHLSLSLWANKTLEEGVPPATYTLADAVSRAMELDDPTLFDQHHGLDDMVLAHRQTAVAGVAYVAARFCNDDEWTAEAGLWCVDVLNRATATLESPGQMSGRGSMLTMHPVTFAVHGLGALLHRGVEVDATQKALLSLATDALEGVVSAVVASTDLFAERYPDFVWALFDLLLRQCIVPRGQIPDFHSVQWDDAEAAHKLALLEAAERSLDEGTSPDLPSIPMPWVLREGGAIPESDTGAYEHNDVVFLDHLAKATLLKLPVATLLSPSNRRQAFLDCVAQLVEMTLQDMVPPFADSRREYRGRMPYEWVGAFFHWCAGLATHLTPDEVHSLILAPIFAKDNETALHATEYFFPSFMIAALLPPAVVTDDKAAIWREVANWVLAHPEASRTDDRLGRHFTSCALAILFCAGGAFSPVRCGIEPGWPELRRFIPTIEQAIRRFGQNSLLFMAVATFLKAGGSDLLPNPALGWLKEIAIAKKQDRKFWNANGDDMVKILKVLVDVKAAQLGQAEHDTITLISDILVDNGVRGAGFLQQSQ